MALTSRELAQEQLKELTDKQSPKKQASKVTPDRKAAIVYNSELQKLSRAVKKDIDEIIIPLVRSLEFQYIGDSASSASWVDILTKAFRKLNERWGSLSFLGAAESISKKFINSLNGNNRRKYSRSVKVIGITGIDVFGDSTKLQDILSASIEENVQLIKTIPGQYLNQVQTAVMSNMRSGLRPSSIVKQLSEQYGITKKRATVIARDQTSKANGMLSKQRQQDTGFEYFKWVDSDDSRVRTRHEKIANADVGYGKGIYKWNNPPKNEKGQQIIPGSEINCRCVSVPITSKQATTGSEK